jgi:hypothetical protein
MFCCTSRRSSRVPAAKSWGSSGVSSMCRVLLLLLFLLLPDCCLAPLPSLSARLWHAVRNTRLLTEHLCAKLTMNLSPLQPDGFHDGSRRGSNSVDGEDDDAGQDSSFSRPFDPQLVRARHPPQASTHKSLAGNLCPAVCRRTRLRCWRNTICCWSSSIQTQTHISHTRTHTHTNTQKRGHNLSVHTHKQTPCRRTLSNQSHHRTVSHVKQPAAGEQGMPRD